MGQRDDMVGVVLDNVVKKYGDRAVVNDVSLEIRDKEFFILLGPSGFLLDEPLSNIDAKLRLEMRAELIRLQKELQTTMIYVTHDQIEALTMADRIAVMDKGRVLQVGDPMEIFENPASKFVGGFI